MTPGKRPMAGRYGRIVTLPTVHLLPAPTSSRPSKLLAELKVDCRNAARPAGDSHPVTRQETYVRYATITEQRLHTFVSFSEAAAFFNGPRHRNICSMTPGSQLELMIGAKVDDQAAVRGLGAAAEGRPGPLRPVLTPPWCSTSLLPRTPRQAQGRGLPRTGAEAREDQGPRADGRR